MLPPEIPLFPLPNGVLFPGAFLPLHIFEPRYRAMVADALAGNRLIGIVLIRPRGKPDEDTHPLVYSIGCAGLISHADRLDDGRYNVIVRGLEKFRILDELADSDTLHAHPYRIARIEAIPEARFATDHDAFEDERHRLEALLTPHIAGTNRYGPLPLGVSDEDLVNALAQHLSLDPLEKQALLERDGLLARCQSLIEILEMRELASRSRSPRNSTTH